MAREPASWKDRLRRFGVMPLLAGGFTYLRAGGPLGGRAALHYTYERVVFESLMAMRLLGEINQHLTGQVPPSPTPQPDEPPSREACIAQ